VDMFNSEFRARLSLIMSPFPSLICFSKARIEWMLVSGPMLAFTWYQCRECLGVCLRTSIPTLTLDLGGLAAWPSGSLKGTASRGGRQ